MSIQVDASGRSGTQPTGQRRRTGLIARLRGSSASYGAGSGVVGGACCAGGAAVQGIGLTSAASVSAFMGAFEPFFVAVSVVLMLSALIWMAWRAGFRRKALAGAVIRRGAVMGGVYGVTLAAALSLGMLT